MSLREQFELFAGSLGDDWNQHVAPMKPEYAWRISSRDFATMTVTASIDASSSGHWHGNITGGRIA